MSRLGIISNPHAKINRNDPEHNTLLRYLLGSQGRFEVTQSIEDLQKTCVDFAKSEIDVVGILGGDGTVTLTLAALEKAYGVENLPKIMLLRGGTVNVLTTNLGIFGKPKDIMSDFLDFINSNNPLYEMSLRSFLVNEEISFIFGTGASVKFLEQFYENKTSAWGAGKFFTSVVADGLTAGRITGQSKALLKQEKLKFNATLSSKTREIHVSTPTLLASSLPKIPYGLEFFPDLKQDNRRAELVYSNLQSSAFAWEVAKSVMRPDKSRSKLERVTFDHLDLQLSECLKYTIDGEIRTAEDGKITIKMGPSFKFLSPYGRML